MESMEAWKWSFPRDHGSPGCRQKLHKTLSFSGIHRALHKPLAVHISKKKRPEINKNVRNRGAIGLLRILLPACCDSAKLFCEAETPRDLVINHRDFISICRSELFNYRLIFL